MVFSDAVIDPDCVMRAEAAGEETCMPLVWPLERFRRLRSPPSPLPQSKWVPERALHLSQPDFWPVHLGCHTNTTGPPGVVCCQVCLAIAHPLGYVLRRRLLQLLFLKILRPFFLRERQQGTMIENCKGPSRRLGGRLFKGGRTGHLV